MLKPFAKLFTNSLREKGEAVIIYLGRPSEFLQLTSERLAVPVEGCTLGQLLQKLRSRDSRWQHELDDAHVLCAINGRAASWHDPITAGSEVCLSSNRSVFEA